MQLAGNPSLIDPTKNGPSLRPRLVDEDMPSFGGGMMMAADDGPTDAVESTPATPMVQGLDGAADLQHSDNDDALASKQAICPVSDMKLGSMGPPVKVFVDGLPVFICCEGCRQRLLAEPAKYLAKLNSRATPEEEAR